MADPNLKVNEELSRVDRHLAELARAHPDAKDLAGKWPAPRKRPRPCSARARNRST
jgi:hypothetical protein